MKLAIVILVVVVLLVLWLAGTYNGLVKKEKRCGRRRSPPWMCT